SAEFTIGEGELMAHDVPLGCAPDEYDDLISGTCSHLPKRSAYFPTNITSRKISHSKNNLKNHLLKCKYGA
ncbi:hypothetical protein ACYCI1_08205, partial [Klebsiella pneumoniae]